MLSINLPLVAWGYGVFFIGVFAAVCVFLVIALFLFIFDDKKQKPNETKEN